MASKKKSSYKKGSGSRKSYSTKRKVSGTTAQSRDVVTNYHEKNAENREKMYGRRYGIHYNPNLSAKEIAVKVRDFCKQYNGFKISVRSGKATYTQTIDVSIKEIPLDFKLYTDNYLFWYKSPRPKKHYQDVGIKRLTPEAMRIKQEIESYVNSYNHDGSDGMIDYFDVKFYERVEYDWRTLDKPPEAQQIDFDKVTINPKDWEW